MTRAYFIHADFVAVRQGTASTLPQRPTQTRALAPVRLGFESRAVSRISRPASNPSGQFAQAFFAILFLVLLAPGLLHAQRFYPDDPIQAEPPPRSVGSALSRKLSEYYDFFSNTFGHTGEEQPETNKIPALAVNTLGEALDSSWYTNRHYAKRMSVEELVRGPGGGAAPSLDGPWTVVAAKTEGITPGFTIVDSRGRRYVLKFDPLSNPEIATAADVIVSKFFHALGYNVPDNYIVEFPREQLVLGKDVRLADALGREHVMTERNISEILLNVPQPRNGRYRAVASLYVSGKPLGPFRYYGTRRDDPNDVIPHEHRRDLRGLSVFAAWLGHDDSRSINTLDMLAEESGTQYVQHYLIDFGSTLGSASNGVNSARSGHEYLFRWKPAIVQFVTLGLLVPSWAKAKYPDLPSVGLFEWEKFDAERWVPEYRNAAFSNRLPDDEFWAAKQVMAFTDEEIRAIVRTGQYSDPAAEQWIVECLIQRRDKIGRAFFPKVLPFDRFAVPNGSLTFEDLAVKHGLIPSQEYAASANFPKSVRWSRFDNQTEQMTPLPAGTSLLLPPQIQQATPGEYFAVEMAGADSRKSVSVFLRKRENGVEVVGIDRTW
jgi:hypothetical protein